MPRLLAASISIRSSVVPSRIETHDTHRSQASPSCRSVQLRALARMRASEVLPVPRGPTNRTAWLTRSDADAVAEGLDDRVLSDDLGERLGSPAAVQRLVRDRVRHRHLRVCAREVEMPCTLRRADRPRAHHDGRLGPGRSAAPGDDRLVLLPSGSDTVRGSPLRGTRSSTSRRRAAFGSGDLGREFSPAGADCRYRAPLVPRLARLRKDSRGRPARRLGRGATVGRPRFGILSRGEVSEWLMVPLSKSGVRKHRGFESRPLRHRPFARLGRCRRWRVRALAHAPWGALVLVLLAALASTVRPAVGHTATWSDAPIRGEVA